MEANVRFSLADATQSRQLGHCAGMRLITPPIDVVGFRVTTVDYWVVGSHIERFRRSNRNVIGFRVDKETVSEHGLDWVIVK